MIVACADDVLELAARVRDMRPAEVAGMARVALLLRAGLRHRDRDPEQRLREALRDARAALESTTASTGRPTLPSSSELVEWRWERLRYAGVPPGVACELAEDASVDVHELTALVERGCPPAIAARIVAP